MENKQVTMARNRQHVNYNCKHNIIIHSALRNEDTTNKVRQNNLTNGFRGIFVQKGKYMRCLGLSESHKNISKKTVQNGFYHIENMRVPVVMIDLRSLAMLIALILLLLISFFIDHIYRTTWTYLIVALFTIAILILLFLQSSMKISIDNEKLQMNNPIGKKTLSKDKIQKVAYTENSNYKHRMIQYIVMGISVLIIWGIQISNLYESLSKYGFEDGTNVFIPVFMILVFGFSLYRIHSCSRYQKIIKIDIDPGEIKIYPENEHKYQILKDRLDFLMNSS